MLLKRLIEHHPSVFPGEETSRVLHNRALRAGFAFSLISIVAAGFSIFLFLIFSHFPLSEFNLVTEVVFVILVLLSVLSFMVYRFGVSKPKKEGASTVDLTWYQCKTCNKLNFTLDSTLVILHKLEHPNHRTETTTFVVNMYVSERLRTGSISFDILGFVIAFSVYFLGSYSGFPIWIRGTVLIIGILLIILQMSTSSISLLIERVIEGKWRKVSEIKHSYESIPVYTMFNYEIRTRSLHKHNKNTIPLPIPTLVGQIYLAEHVKTSSINDFLWVRFREGIPSEEQLARLLVDAFESQKQVEAVSREDR